jgi:hypothetical protein
MATKANLMGLGESPFLAAIQATDPTSSTSLTAVGGSAASAYQIGPQQFITQFTASNSGAGARLPAVGGSNGCLLGDDFIVNNQITGGLTVYGPPGSEISGGSSGALVSGSGGVTVAVHTTATFYPMTVSQWVCVAGS